MQKKKKFFVGNKSQSVVFSIIMLSYGNTGCGVFKGGIQNKKGFGLKINFSQMKIPNLENWSSGKLSKSAKI